MFQAPDYARTVSLKLSEVLADIGVDEKFVLKRRRTWLLIESIYTRSLQLQDCNVSTKFMGSQSEGTTTSQLNSDTDQLFLMHGFKAVQDWSDWETGLRNYLMIQDETVSPGYCLLQCLRDDVPLPYRDVPDQHYFRDRTGRILLRNKIMSFAAAVGFEGGQRHGPAHTRQGKPGYNDSDIVVAFPCKSWPLQARPWLAKQGVGQWPSDDIKRFCSSTGCFLVGVGSKGSENEELEWRISTSLAERCLMFNLNITQIRCYVLMKMILKTFIKPQFEDTISSFMCKTVLFHCIANTHYSVWREHNLLVCLSVCLYALYNSTSDETCPHFIINENNLMRGHIPQESKPYILEILQTVIKSEGTIFLGIECEDLGARLQLKLYNNACPFKASVIASGDLLKTTAQFIDCNMYNCLTLISNSSSEEAIQTLLKCIVELVIISHQCQGLEKTACYLLAPRFCTAVGSVLASLNIQLYNDVSAEALSWISLGLNTDVASAKLKMASVLYCKGDTQRTEAVLRQVEGSYDLNIVRPICHCHDFIIQHVKDEFFEISDNHNEEAIQNILAFSVRFLPCEIKCVPHELQYEMYRSTKEDLAFRGNMDHWMDWAVVDSLPYLYFLQYKTYSNLGRQADKQRALSKLVRTIHQEPNLGHRETALNLLGQCMEHEDRAADALRYYSLSINLKRRNNAANILICRLLSSIVNES